MKKFSALLLLLLFSNIISAQISIGLEPKSPNQLAIGALKGDPGAILDVKNAENDKGVLFPRVSLTSETMDLDGTGGNPEGLWVYNTGGTLPEGFYYWDGTKFSIVDNRVLEPAQITSLNCDGAYIIPSLIAGEEFAGQLIIPYTGGDGGQYGLTGPFSSRVNTGLTATLPAGTLKSGDGFFTLNVRGTPLYSNNTVNLALFDFDILGFQCTAATGSFVLRAGLASSSYVGPLSPTTDPNPGVQAVVRSPDQLFEVRVYLRENQNINDADLQIRYVGPQAKDTIQWAGGASYDNGKFAGGGGGTSTPIIMDRGVWWGSNGGSNNSTANSPWGPANVFNGNGGMQIRKYAWAQVSPDSGTAYLLKFTGGLSTGVAYANYTETIITLDIDQIDPQ